MNLEQILAAITPEVYENLRYAVETGRWPNGQALSEEQRELCLQAIIAFDVKHRPSDERVGYIDMGRKAKKAAQNEWQKLDIGNSASRGDE